MLGIIRTKGEKFKQNSCLHDYMLENGVVHSLRLICRGMQYAGFRGIAIICNFKTVDASLKRVFRSLEEKVAFG